MHALVVWGSGWHTVAQLPQWVTSVRRLISQPSTGSRLQSSKPVMHGPSAQSPARHWAVELGSVAQALPHMVQFSGSVPRLASQPSSIVLLQSAKLGLHIAMVHAPIAQPGSALAKRQTLPHALQFCGSSAVSTSQPLPRSRSQSA